MNGHAAAIAVIVVLFAFSAVLALVGDRVRARRAASGCCTLAEEGDKRADACSRLLEHPEQTLNSVLLVLLGCQMIVGDAARHRARAELRRGRRRWSASSLEIIVVFTFAEVAPKTFAVQHSDRAVLSRCRRCSCSSRSFAPLRVLTRGFIGLANIVLPGKGLRDGPFVTEDEILTMADVAARGGRRSRPRSASSSTRSSSSATRSCAR